jgi:hypothetical protein
MATKNVNEMSGAALGSKPYTMLEHYESTPPTEWHGAYCGFGPHLHFQAADAELLECNLIGAHDMPNRAKGHAKYFFDGKDYWKSQRLTDGRVSLCISTSLVRQRDSGFSKLMAGLSMFVD